MLFKLFEYTCAGVMTMIGVSLSFIGGILTYIYAMRGNWFMVTIGGSACVALLIITPFLVKEHLDAAKE